MSPIDCAVKISLLDSFFQNAGKSCVPLVTTFEITQGCNYRCHHCYNFDRNGDIPQEILDKSLTPPEIIRIINEVADSGALYLNFTGGEVLLHPHLEDFIKEARKNHLEVRLKTNGSLLTNDRCKKLDTAGLAGLDISLYGMTEVAYEKLTQKKGMLEKTLSGIQEAKKFGFSIAINIILHRYNLVDLGAMIQFCEEHNLHFQFSIEITDRYDNSNGARDFEITEAQFKEMLEGEFSEIFMHFNKNKSVQCSCARTVCGISYSGEVFPCIGAPIPSGNLRQKSFKEIWENSLPLKKIRDLKFSDFKKCTTCDHLEYCNRSSGGIYINTKEYTGCDEITFKQAKARHEFAKK